MTLPTAAAFDSTSAFPPRLSQIDASGLAAVSGADSPAFLAASAAWSSIRARAAG